MRPDRLTLLFSICLHCAAFVVWWDMHEQKSHSSFSERTHQSHTVTLIPAYSEKAEPSGAKPPTELPDVKTQQVASEMVSNEVDQTIPKVTSISPAPKTEKDLDNKEADLEEIDFQESLAQIAEPEIEEKRAVIDESVSRYSEPSQTELPINQITSVAALTAQPDTDIKTSDTLSLNKSAINQLDAKAVSEVEEVFDESMRQAYLEELQALISQIKRYPKRAIRLRQEGVVWIEFTLDENGVFDDVRLRESSGHSILDSAAISTIEGIQKFKPLPRELASNLLSLSVPIQYMIH